MQDQKCLSTSSIHRHFRERIRKMVIDDLSHFVDVVVVVIVVFNCNSHRRHVDIFILLFISDLYLHSVHAHLFCNFIFRNIFIYILKQNKKNNWLGVCCRIARRVSVVISKRKTNKIIILYNFFFFVSLWALPGT